MFSLPPEILANWLQPGALVAGAVGGMGLLIGAFRSLRGDMKGEMREMKEEMKEEMRAGEDRTNKRIDEVREEMKGGLCTTVPKLTKPLFNTRVWGQS